MRDSLTTRPTRRFCLAAVLAYASSAVLPVAWAGAQLEEPLADAVRSALSAAVRGVSAPVPVLHTQAARMEYQRWLAAMSQRLQRRMPVQQVRHAFLQTVWYEAQRAGLEVSLVLAVIEVESGFRKHAISVAGARGYMQIMPFWVRLIGDGDASKLFHAQTNLRFGCVILRHYLDREKGDLFMALGRYNGSRGKPRYPGWVLAAQQRWLVDANEGT